MFILTTSFFVMINGFLMSLPLITMGGKLKGETDKTHKNKYRFILLAIWICQYILASASIDIESSSKALEVSYILLIPALLATGVIVLSHSLFLIVTKHEKEI